MKKTLLWLVAIPLIATGSITYATDNEFIVHDTASWTITVYSQDKSYWITIQDKNLWATVAGTGCTDLNRRVLCLWLDGTYWYYFQWWNNHGNYAWTNTWTMNELLNADVNGWVNKWYSGDNDKFIVFTNTIDHNKKTRDYWNGVYYTNANYNSYIWESPYNNLWWGWSDNEEQENIIKWYDTVNHVVTNVENRQWPCPDGYHVPSAWEWNELVKLYAQAKWYTLNDQSGEYSWSNTISEVVNFSWDLLLPLAGNRSRSDGRSSYAGYVGAYLSSSPRGGSNPQYVWSLSIHPTYITPSNDTYRALGQSIRCFKNSYVKLPKTLNLSFMSDGEEVWTWEVTENMTGAIPEEAKNVTKTGYILEYRYLSGADATTGFDFENTPISWAWADENNNVYFIAQWTPITYSVEFTWTDVEWTMNLQTFTYGVTWTLNRNAFTKNWYTFSGWTDWTTWYTDGQEVVNLTTTNGDVITLTAEWTKIETKPSWGSSGGGGRKNKTSDTQDSSAMPQNDNKSSSWTKVKDLRWDTQDSSVNVSEWQNQQQFTKEFQEAYEFAYEKWITTMPTINDANMNWKLTRIAMAKMLSYYAINVLWQKPDETRNNKFNDITDKLDAQYDSGVTLAYQLWIMWINMPDNMFRPNDEVTRAEFVTALSRMLYSTPDGKPYYATHLQKLKAEWILKNDDYKMKELRGYVMIMLKRSAK